jgi:hypothetical protein
VLCGVVKGISVDENKIKIERNTIEEKRGGEVAHEASEVRKDERAGGVGG